MGLIGYLKKWYRYNVSQKWSRDGGSYNAYKVDSVENYGVMTTECTCVDETHLDTGEERTRVIISIGGNAVSFDQFNSKGKYSCFVPLTEDDKEKVIQNADN